MIALVLLSSFKFFLVLLLVLRNGNFSVEPDFLKTFYTKDGDVYWRSLSSLLSGKIEGSQTPVQQDLFLNGKLKLQWFGSFLQIIDWNGQTDSQTHKHAIDNKERK